MATANQGKQEVTIGYKQRVSSLVVNKLLRGILRPGLYTGGEVSVVNSNTLNLESFSVLINSEFTETDNLGNTTNSKIIVKVSSFEDIKFDTTGVGVNTQKVLWGSFTWAKAKANYMNFGFSNVGANPVDSIVFSTVYFDGSGNIINLSDINNTLGTEQYILSYITTNFQTILVTQIGHGFTTVDIGKPLFVDNLGFQLAQADTEARATVVGFVSSIVDSNSFYLNLPYGRLSGLTLTSGDKYYLDPVNPGLVVNSPPVLIGQVRKLLYVAISTSEAVIINDPGEMIGTANTFVPLTIPNATTAVLTTYNCKIELMEFVAGGTNQNYATIFYVAGQVPAIQTFPGSLISSVQSLAGYINIYDNAGLEVENLTGAPIQIFYKIET